MEVFHFDLANVFIQCWRQIDNELELVNCVKKGCNRVIVQFFQFLTVDLNHFHV